MTVSATSRNVVRTLAHRVQIDWSRPVFSLSPEVASTYNKLKSWVFTAEGMYEKYQKPPTPIDFAAAKKKVRDAVLVESLEKFYKANTPPPEKYEWSPEEISETDAQISYLKELDNMNKEMLPVLTEELNFLQANRTTKESTIFDMEVNYPLIHEEIEDELERREWFKDTGFDTNK